MNQKEQEYNLDFSEIEIEENVVQNMISSKERFFNRKLPESFKDELLDEVLRFMAEFLSVSEKFRKTHNIK